MKSHGSVFITTYNFIENFFFWIQYKTKHVCKRWWICVMWESCQGIPCNVMHVRWSVRCTHNSHMCETELISGIKLAGRLIRGHVNVIVTMNYILSNMATIMISANHFRDASASIPNKSSASGSSWKWTWS